MSKQPPPAPTSSAVGPCPTVIQIVGRPGTGSLPSTIAPPDHPLQGSGIQYHTHHHRCPQCHYYVRYLKVRITRHGWGINQGTCSSTTGCRVTRHGWGINQGTCNTSTGLVGFGFNGHLRQYFSLYRAVSQREGERGEKRIDESKNVQTTPTRTCCKRSRPLPYCNPNCRTPRHWKFTQHHRTTQPPPSSTGCWITGHCWGITQGTYSNSSSTRCKGLRSIFILSGQQG